MKPSKPIQLILIILLAAILLSMLGCIGYKQKRKDKICATCPEKYRIDSISTERFTETLRDTTIYIPADSSWYRAYVKCVNGKPIIVNSKQKDGKRTTLSVEIDSDGILSVNAKVDSLMQVITVKDRERETISKMYQEAIIKQCPKPRFMENVFYYVGMVTCFLISIIFIVIAVLMAIGKRVTKFLD